MRRFISLLALLCSPIAVFAQGTKADTTLAAQVNAQLTTIARDKGAPQYSKKAQDSIAKLVAAHLKPASAPTPPSDPNAPATIAIHSNGTSVVAGQTLQLYSEVKNVSGASNTTTPVVWTALQPAVATVNANGLLTGVSAGTVSVRARADTASTTRTYTVTAAQPPPVDTTTPPDTVKPPIPPVDTTSGVSIAAQPQNVPVPQYPSCATTIRALTSTDLNAALKSAQGGACILLNAGTSFVGNFTLPNRASTGFVTIQTEGYVNKPGVRMTPTKAIPLAKIQSATYTEAIGTDPGAHGYIFRGVEIGATGAQQSTGGMNVLVRLTDGVQGTNIPRDIQFQQVYVHGTPTMELRRTFRADAQYAVLVDSWVDDAHSNNSDSQAWLGLNCAQHQLIQNNTLKAGHEIVMFGGGDPSSVACIPSDIVLRQNHIYHPTNWYKVWQVKNCIETKNVMRYLVEANVIENVWADAQNGFCFVMKSENQDGSIVGNSTTTSDVTIRYNLIRNVSNVWNLSGKGSSSNPNITSARYDIHDNVCQNVNPPQWSGGSGIVVQLLSSITDVQMRRVSCYNNATSQSTISMDGAPAVRLVMDGDAMHHGQYGAKCSGQAVGKGSLDACAPGYVWKNMVLVNASCAQYPTGTSCPTSFPALPTATVGADTAKVNLLTSGVVVSDPLGARRAAGRLTTPWKPSPLACQKPGVLPAYCDQGVK